MRKGIAWLIFGFVLSQFFRAFLAVLTPVLELELSASKEDLAAASGYWFLAFAAFQLPVGALFDRIGPRRTTAGFLILASMGAALFATAQTPLTIKIAMILIGSGCAPILMASFFIYSRQFSPALFGTLAGMTVGIGSLGDILSSLPLALVAEAWGWRSALWIMAGLSMLTSLGVYLFIKDPQQLETRGHGSLWTVIKDRRLWPVIAMMLVCYAAPSALRGLWLGPYFHDIWDFDRTAIGWTGMAMGLGLVTGSMAIGPIARWAGTAKWVVVTSNLIMCTALLLLWLHPFSDAQTAVLLFALIGLFGATFPVVTAHARIFIPPHLMGRGVTFINLCGIITVGISQQITGRLHTALDSPATPLLPFNAIFLFFGLSVALGLTIYLCATERTD